MSKSPVHHVTLGSQLAQQAADAAEWPAQLNHFVSDPDQASLEMYILLLFIAEYAVTASAPGKRDAVLSALYGAASGHFANDPTALISNRHQVYAQVLNSMMPGKGVGEQLARKMLVTFCDCHDVGAWGYAGSTASTFGGNIKKFLDGLEVR